MLQSLQPFPCDPMVGVQLQDALIDGNRQIDLAILKNLVANRAQEIRVPRRHIDRGGVLLQRCGLVGIGI